MTDTSLSPVVFGGTSAATMRNAVELNRDAVASASHATRADRFWSSSAAYVTDPIKEVLEINYASAGITNKISFDAVRFPHTITMEYTDSQLSGWQPVLDARTQRPVEIVVSGSYPPVLNDPSTIIGHFHPQHDYEGHWTRHEVQCSVAQMQKLRFILQRSGGNGPVNVNGQAVPYSLALQNVDTGYRISEEGDIPFHLEEENSDTSGTVFANSADLFGSNLGFSKKTHKANNLIYNTDDNAPLIWKSEPQPNPYSVVNFYADLRDSAGNAQVVDQIFIDPLYLGCSVNLYYSNDQVQGDFLSARKGLTSSQAVFSGAAIKNNGPLDLGSWHPDTDGTDINGNPITIPAHFDPYYVQIDNFALGFDPSIDWWVGMEWTRGWSRITDTADHDLFSCDAFRVGQNQDNFYLATANGDKVNIPNVTQENVPIQILASYNDGLLSLYVQQQGALFTTSFAASVPIDASLPAQLIIGSNYDNTIFSGGQITSFVLVQGKEDPGFLANPSDHSTVPLMASAEKVSKYNTLLRFDTSQLSITNSTGFIGGAAHPYEEMTWTPIPRTYEMQRGQMKLPATKAKFWNLEISNLRPENNEKYVPVTRNIKYFPPELFTPSNTTTATTRKTDDHLALSVQQSLSTAYVYRDQPQFVGTGEPLSGVTDTEVYVATDPAVADRLATTGNQWKYQQFHADRGAPRFPQVSKHVYQVIPTTQTTNVSYFAGLRQIVFSKTIRSAPQNAPVIEESFLSDDTLADGNWNVTGDALSSGTVAGHTFVQSKSIKLPTQTGLRGLQFAAQQSDAQTIDIGGDFSNPTYDPTLASQWVAYGDGKIFGLEYNQNVDVLALHVSRATDQGYWADVQLNWGSTYGALEAAHVTWGSFTQGIHNGGYTGGVQSASIPAPHGGKVHAAVRATALQNLTQPLFVQIVDADSGQVLAESESNVSKNEVKQWYASLDLRDFNSHVGNFWGNLTGKTSWQSFSDAFGRANAATLGNMDSGQTWKTPAGSNPFTIASGNAVAPSTLGRSEVDTGTPWGTLSVRYSTVATTTTHSAAVPILDLGGILLLNDGTFIDQNISVNFGTLGETVTTAHDYNFKFMLTSQVASGQRPVGVDPTIQPYSLVISTGTLGSDTWLSTLSSSRAFTSLRALLGPSGTAFSKFAWTPLTTQVSQDNFFPRQIQPTTLTDEDTGNYSYIYNGRKILYTGTYTYATTNGALSAASVGAATFVANPAVPTLSPVSSGGMFTAGTQYYKVTALSATGETGPSPEASVTVVANGLVNLSWTAVTGATGYNIYRGTSTGQNFLVASSATNSFQDTGDTNDTGRLVPAYNTTGRNGTRQVMDMIDQYGTFRFNVTQMPSNMAALDVKIAYLDYNPVGNSVITLRGNGYIIDEGSGATLGTIPSFNPLAGPITLHFANTALLSSAFLTAHPQAGPQSILVYQNGTTYLGSYSVAGANTWTSTVRGLGGAGNGTSAGQYTIIEGFNWNPSGNVLAPDTHTVTWGMATYNHSRTYTQMSQVIQGSTQNLLLRVVQKNPAGDSWFIQSAEFFWDPVVWEFSCDGGTTFWPASEIRNDPRGVILFPTGLTAYNSLVWRLTSYAGRVSVSHLAIRPWYVGMHGYVPPAPSHLPQGPNVVPADDYAPIERDPRWMAWDRPVPRWWWNQGLATTR